MHSDGGVRCSGAMDEHLEGFPAHNLDFFTLGLRSRDFARDCLPDARLCSTYKRNACTSSPLHSFLMRLNSMEGLFVATLAIVLESSPGAKRLAVTVDGLGARNETGVDDDDLDFDPSSILSANSEAVTDDC